MTIPAEYGCKCCAETDDPHDIMRRHGSIEAFRRALENAVPSYISYGEAADACDRYRQLLDQAWAAKRARESDGKA